MKRVKAFLERNSEKIIDGLGAMYFAAMLIILMLGNVIVSLLMCLAVFVVAYNDVSSKENVHEKHYDEHTDYEETDDMSEEEKAFLAKYNRQFYGDREVYAGKKVS